MHASLVVTARPLNQPEFRRKQGLFLAPDNLAVYVLTRTQLWIPE